MDIKSSKDITDIEFYNILVPYHNNFENYMEKYIIPETFAFDLANSHYRDCLCDASLQIHYNSMCDVFNGFNESFYIVKPFVIELLKIKYNLVIVSDNPLVLEKWQYLYV